MPNILKRTIFGALFVAITCFAILFWDGALCGLYMLLCGFIMIYEFTKMFKMSAIDLLMVTVIGGEIISATDLYYGYSWAFIPALALIFIYFIIYLFKKDTKQEEHLGKAFLTLIYIALPLGIASYISRNDHLLIMATFLLIWISDTMAYLVGCKFGKHKIFVRISPKKSWEGAIGGFVFTVTASAFGGYLFPKLGFAVWQWCVIGATVGIFAILGDFIESMFKRSADVKDSGNLIPGHGGLLDRLDSFIFTIPWIAIAVWIMRMF
ncbi:MAG: phosphatidate cytidylyltransferase [Bacteroidales bacterium]|nr:phosphatidate cytidylyltransferase [Bacteroidales bacterium]